MKMMMKAEMASEMIRSRIQTPNPDAGRVSELAPGATAAKVAGSVAFSGAALSSESGFDMRIHCIQNEQGRRRIVVVKWILPCDVARRVRDCPGAFPAHPNPRGGLQ